LTEFFIWIQCNIIVRRRGKRRSLDIILLDQKVGFSLISLDLKLFYDHLINYGPLDRIISNKWKNLFYLPFWIEEVRSNVLFPNAALNTKSTANNVKILFKSVKHCFQCSVILWMRQTPNNAHRLVDQKNRKC